MANAERLLATKINRLSKELSEVKDLLSECRAKLGLPTRYTGRDPLAEATKGKLHWHDPGMKQLEMDGEWEEMFALGAKVEVKTKAGWAAGAIVETPLQNDRAIVVKCDEKIHDNTDFYAGHGITVMVYMNTRRGILCRIRPIGEKA